MNSKYHETILPKTSFNWIQHNIEDNGVLGKWYLRSLATRDWQAITYVNDSMPNEELENYRDHQRCLSEEITTNWVLTSVLEEMRQCTGSFVIFCDMFYTSAMMTNVLRACNEGNLHTPLSEVIQLGKRFFCAEEAYCFETEPNRDALLNLLDDLASVPHAYFVVVQGIEAPYPGQTVQQSVLKRWMGRVTLFGCGLYDLDSWMLVRTQAI